jgi:hypothetical protein
VPYPEVRHSCIERLNRGSLMRIDFELVAVS